MARTSKQWEELKNQRLRIQCKSGILLEGMLVGLEGTLLVLTTAKIVSSGNYTAEPSWIHVDTDAVIACFPEDDSFSPH